MPIDSETLAAGAWCTRQDCSDVIGELLDAIGDDESFLDRCISKATERAKAILRSRWPNTFPWAGNPPEEIRDAVATMATYRAMRNRVFSGGAMEIVDTLRLDNNRSEDTLNRIADSQEHPEISQAVGEQRAAVAAAPKGEFGFK